MKKDTLYYDGQCPLCRAEMAKLAKFADGSLHLQDIHALNTNSSELSMGPCAVPDKSVLMERLHLQKADGSWLVGVDANVEAWQHTPFARRWRMLNWPVIRWFSRLGYEAWLVWRRLTKRSV